MRVFTQRSGVGRCARAQRTRGKSFPPPVAGPELAAGDLASAGADIDCDELAHVPGDELRPDPLLVNGITAAGELVEFELFVCGRHG